MKNLSVLRNLSAIDEDSFYVAMPGGGERFKRGARVVLVSPLPGLGLEPGAAGIVLEPVPQSGHFVTGVEVIFDHMVMSVVVPSSARLVLGWALNLRKAMGLRFDKVRDGNLARRGDHLPTSRAIFKKKIKKNSMLF